jgi:hypothetical protein
VAFANKHLIIFTLIRPSATFSLQGEGIKRDTRLAKLPLPAGEGWGEGERRKL